MELDEPVQVYGAWNSMQAHFLRNLLADEGIEARVVSDAVESIRGEVPFQKATCPVWVAGADAERARVVVAEYERRLKGSDSPSGDAAKPFCYHCGQAIEAGCSPCPSCGMELDWSE
jgi:hypothetical protein